MSDKSAKKEALCKLFVGGLRRDTKEDVFRDYFSKYGELTDSVIICDKNRVSRGFGFVSYETPEILDNVLITRPHIVDDKEVDVRRATPKSQMGDPQPKRSPKIFVGGLHKDVTPDEVREYFDSRFYHLGPVKEVDIKKNREGEPRGFGFVVFENEDVPERVLLEDLDVIFHGKRCNLKAAIPKDQSANSSLASTDRPSPRRTSRDSFARNHDYYEDRRPSYPPNRYEYPGDYYDQGSFYPPPPPPPMAGGHTSSYRSNEAYSPQGHIPSPVGERSRIPSIPPHSIPGSYEHYNNDRIYGAARGYAPSGGPRGGRSSSGYRAGGSNTRPRPY